MKWLFLTYRANTFQDASKYDSLWIGVIVWMLGAQVDDIAVLTMQCWCPAIIYSYDGKLKKESFPRLHSSSLFYFYIFILHQSQHSEVDENWVSK
jgi:hypothetical protein